MKLFGWDGNACFVRFHFILFTMIWPQQAKIRLACKQFKWWTSKTSLSKQTSFEADILKCIYFADKWIHCIVNSYLLMALRSIGIKKMVCFIVSNEYKQQCVGLRSILYENAILTVKLYIKRVHLMNNAKAIFCVSINFNLLFPMYKCMQSK